MDRRTFLSTSLVLPAFQLRGLDNNQPECCYCGSPDRCFMAFDQYLADVGERRALRDLRYYMFPVIPQQYLLSRDEREFKQTLRSISRRYRSDDTQGWDDYSIEARCCLLHARPATRRIRDWWLVALRDSETGKLEALRVVFVSSLDGEVAASLNLWLAARVTYRLHCRWESLTNKYREAATLVPTINRQITAAIATMPTRSC